MAIIAMVTAIIIFNQGGLTDEVAIGNTGNDIALQIREAQIYGISVKEVTPGSNQFSVAYGADFNLGPVGGSTSSFILFADTVTQNGFYNTPGSCTLGSSECLVQSQISHGNTISKLCVIPAAGPEVCSPAVSRVDITFLRPDPSARIVFFDASGNITSYPGYLGADLVFTSPKSRLKHVYVYTTGQISVQ